MFFQDGVLLNTIALIFFCLSRPYHFKFFKGCLQQILLGPFLNTLSQMIFMISEGHVPEFMWVVAALFLNGCFMKKNARYSVCQILQK